jgi:hypothetical protein
MPKQTKEFILKSRLDKMFAKKPELQNFSYFFRDASPEEQKRLMEDVARKANQNQRELVEQYHQANQKPA